MWAVVVLTVTLAMSSAALRPFYNIGHMANSLAEVEDFLARGANALEADISFFEDGTPLCTFHETPCDCMRVCELGADLPTYLQNLHGRKELALLFLDLKVSRLGVSAQYAAGHRLVNTLLKHLWVNSSANYVNVLLSVGHVRDNATLRGAMDALKSRPDILYWRVGWDIGMNDDLQSIQDLWKELGVTANRWQGDGLTNCLNPFRSLSRLQEAIQIRDSAHGFIDKTYYWTVDLTEMLENVLRVGVDGIITNWPDRLYATLRSAEFSSVYRLATRADSPWQRYIQPESTKRVLGNVLVPAWRSNSLERASVTFLELFQAWLRFLWDLWNLPQKEGQGLWELIRLMTPAAPNF